ncbi:ABC transporter permease subunit [Streptomyces sp. NPDC093808]|uniref:ABC transporter permease subunit n=1 Tax=Streptomyces sp. NPDC093808 TaxID=3154985 RepID=UPI0034506BE4
MTTTDRPYRVAPARVLRSEWHKLTTLRSTWITLPFSAVPIVGVGLIVSAHYETGSRQFVDPVELGPAGTQIAMISLPVLGVLFTAGEYTTGTIRATLAAVPRRVPVLWAKAGILVAVVLPLTLITCLIGHPLAQTLLTGTDQETSLTDPGVLAAVTGTAAGITALTALAMALGALLRSVAGGIGAFVGGVMVLPEVIGMIPVGAVDRAAEYFPAQAAGNVSALDTVAGAPAPGLSLLALGLWAFGTVVAAGVLLQRRDV